MVRKKLQNLGPNMTSVITFSFIALLFLSLYFELCVSSCDSSHTTTLRTTLTGRKNKTGRWVTEVNVDYGGQHLPNQYNVNVEHSEGQCDGHRTFHVTGEVSVPPPVPEYYELWEHVGYYKFHTQVKTWNQARDICEQEGGHLAIINSEQESVVMAEYLARYPSVKGAKYKDYALIGFHDKFQEGQYITVLGHPIDTTGFTRWSGPGQPDDIGGHENCGSVYKNGGLNDIGCDVPEPFICEFEL